MKKPGTFICFFCLAILLLSLQALAEEKPTLDHGFQLYASDAACPPGDVVLNVNRKVINSLDSGTGKNEFYQPWWAYSDYIQHIRVVDTGVNYCATVTMQGSFDTVNGDGPGCQTFGTCDCFDGTCESPYELAEGVVGTFQGGSIITLTAAFDPGDKKTKGSIGLLDGQCNAAVGCPGPVSTRWIQEYFPGATYDYDWWGWIYHAGNNGVWINSADGNEGNIAGE